MDLSLDISLYGKKIQINIDNISDNAKKEIETLLKKSNLDTKDIIRAYIQKTQECSELENKIHNLTNKLEQI